MISGERAVRDCILEGRRIADLSQDPDKGRIRQVCDNLDRLMGDLADLRRMGKVLLLYTCTWIINGILSCSTKEESHSGGRAVGILIHSLSHCSPH